MLLQFSLICLKTLSKRQDAVFFKKLSLWSDLYHCSLRFWSKGTSYFLQAMYLVIEQINERTSHLGPCLKFGSHFDYCSDQYQMFDLWRIYMKLLPLADLIYCLFLWEVNSYFPHRRWPEYYRSHCVRAFWQAEHLTSGLLLHWLEMELNHIIKQIL